jgi:hypothetical protein
MAGSRRKRLLPFPGALLPVESVQLIGNQIFTDGVFSGYAGIVFCRTHFGCSRTALLSRPVVNSVVFAIHFLVHRQIRLSILFHEGHPALGTFARLIGDDVGVHRARVLFGRGLSGLAGRRTRTAATGQGRTQAEGG